MGLSSERSGSLKIAEVQSRFEDDSGAGASAAAAAAPKKKNKNKNKLPTESSPAQSKVSAGMDRFVKAVCALGFRVVGQVCRSPFACCLSALRIRPLLTLTLAHWPVGREQQRVCAVRLCETAGCTQAVTL